MRYSRIDYTKIFVILLFLALFIRLAGINQFLETDEVHWARAAQQGNYMQPKIPNSQLSVWAMIPFVEIFGAHTWAIRLGFILAGMLTIYYVYLTSKMLFGKKSAIWSLFLITISSWHILASLQITYEGSFLALFFIQCAYFYLKFEQTTNKKYLYLTGLSFGLATLTKLPAVLFLPMIWIYGMIRTKEFKNVTKNSIIIALIGFVIFLIYPIISIITKSPSFVVSLYYFFVVPTIVTSTITNIGLLAIQFLYAILWAGPLLIGLFLLSMKKIRKKHLLFFVWIFFMIIFYTFIVQDNFRPMERYMMIIIPPLAILGGNVIARLRLNKKILFFAGIIFIASLGAFAVLSSLQSQFLPFYPKTGFITEALKLNWNFLVPFIGSSGPVGFYLKFSIIAFSFIASGLMLASALVFHKNRELSRLLITGFIAIGLGYNIFLAQEYLLNLTQPDISQISYELVEYANQNELKKPLFIFKNKAIPFYLDSRYTQREDHLFTFDYFNLSAYLPKEFYQKWFEFSVSFYDYNDIYFLNFETNYNQSLYLAEQYTNTTKAEPVQLNGTVLIIDFPYMGKQSSLWQNLNNCDILKIFKSKGIPIGYVFAC